MLQDPDGQFEDHAIEIKADNKIKAENICQELATRQSDAFTIVKCLGCTARTLTTGKFICTMRVETVEPPSTQPPEDSNG
jgi:hypothetical protein